MPGEGDVQQALGVLEQYNQQLEAVARQLQLLQGLYEETTRARDALEGLRKSEGSEVLVPLGANTFIAAKVGMKERVLTGIGASLSVEKPWTEAEERLAENAKRVEAEIQRLTQGAAQLQGEVARLQDEIEAVMATRHPGA